MEESLTGGESQQKEAAIHLCDFGLSLGGRKILAEISIDLHFDRVVALLGPSGVGKTSLLRAMAGLIPGDSGRLALAADARVAMMFQVPPLLPWLTVAENISLPMRIREQGGDSGSLVRDIGLSGVAERLPGELSVGMRRRVALAQALAASPNVLLLDEPFSGLDPVRKATMVRLVRRALDEESRGCALVTHDIREAAFLADEIVVLGGRPGRVLLKVENDDGPQESQNYWDATIPHDLEHELLAAYVKAVELEGDQAPR